jgi:hypothetical protein
VASIAAAVAGLAKRQDLSIPARDPHLRDVIFDSPRRSSTHDGGLRVFEQGGVSVANETVYGRHIHLVFDHGPLGLMPLAAHGHADALAIWLTIDGEPVFVDAGTYRYFSGGETRSALREGLAHNSLVIDGLTPSHVATAFSWKTSANARLVKAAHGQAWSVAGEHDGYCKAFAVRHLRCIRRAETGFFIDDRLVGNTRSLPVTLRFLCDPGVTIARDGDDVVIHGLRGVLCRLAPPHGFAVDLAETMHSRRFGHLAPTFQIILAGELNDDVVTTQIAIAGPAKARAHFGNEAVIASPTQSDMREKEWH